MRTLFHRRTMAMHNERGAVMVLAAVTLPVILLFVAFGVEVGHWFDYSRNLQNRADAAALAAGDQYGGTCFGNYTTTQTNAIGEAAQQYAGPPTQDPSNPYTVPNNLPYAYGTFAQSAYKNVPNLTKGSPPNYHLLLNSPADWNKSGADWSMGAGAAKGSSLALCSSTDEDGNTGAMADVRLTQANLSLFFPLFGVKPTISAHARVSLQGSAGSSAVIPIAVRDPGSIQCVAINYVNNVTGNPINPNPIAMTPEGTDPDTGDIIWDVPAGTQVSMPPAGKNAGVYVQVVTGPCGDNPQTYNPTGGLLYINSWSKNSTPSTPVITTNGVSLSNTCANDHLSNMYFTNESCDVSLTANVLFPAGASNKNVSAIDTVNGTAVASIALNNTSGNVWTTPNNKPFTIDPVANPGAHQFVIQASTGSGTNKVTTDLGVQQQAFAACNEAISTCPNNGASGPIVLAQLRNLSDASGLPKAHTGVYGQDAFPETTPTTPAPTLVVTLEIAGLDKTPPANAPVILRFSENCGGMGQQFCSHATGLINCGQTSQGTSQAIAAIVGGCPAAGSADCPIGSNNFDFCSPLAINYRNNTCTPAGSQIPPATAPSFRSATDPTVPADCIGLVGGNKTPIAKAVACRIFTNSPPTDCAQGQTKQPNCSANNWDPNLGATSIPANDPRAITMVITAPEDLAGNNGPPVPIRNFATFYVVGWNTQGSAQDCSTYSPLAPTAGPNAYHYNQCTDNTAPAPTGPAPNSCKNNGKGANGGEPGEIWGYWMTYTDPNGIPLPTLCNPSALTTCTPALTR